MYNIYEVDEKSCKLNCSIAIGILNNIKILEIIYAKNVIFLLINNIQLINILLYLMYYVDKN